MHINLRKNKNGVLRLMVTFEYKPAIVAKIREIPGRQYIAAGKCWEIPIENAEECVRTLSPLGFAVHADVRAILSKEKAIREAADAIRSSATAVYNGSLPLFDFQKVGVAFLRSMPHALLADVPGLGKSIQTIAAHEDSDGPHLILVPASLKYSWKDELEKWQPGAKVLVINGNKQDRVGQWYYANRVKWIIANYELLLYDFDEMAKHNWESIVTDEATRISNPYAKSVVALKKLVARKRIALTGTPISNTPDDIFSIIDWLSPGFLGSFNQFRERYCIIDESWGKVIGYKNLKDLSDKVARFMLRRTKEEVLKDLPPKTVKDIVFDLSDDERKTYESVKLMIMEEIWKLGDKIDPQTLVMIPVKMLRLKQCTDHTKLIGAEGIASTKLETMKAMLKEIVAGGDKAIIFTQFAEMVHILVEELTEFRPLAVYGDVDSQDRMIRVKEFNDDPKGRVIIMTEAGAYGLNMQSASYVFHYDMPWSIAKLTQREDRAHRHGQKKPVTVYNLIAKKTIDEYVAKVLHKKNKVAVEILQDGERLENAGLSEEDIKEILRIN